MAAPTSAAFWCPGTVVRAGMQPTVLRSPPLGGLAHHLPLHAAASSCAFSRSALQGRRLQLQPCLAPQQRRRRRGLQPCQAMFDGLTRSLNKAWDLVRKDGKLTPENIKAPMREIRRALLEADVSLPVVRQFVASAEAAALGAPVVRGVTPDQQLVKVVHNQLVQLMGGQQAGLAEPPRGPQVILMAGLQGVGKTTACGKLALALRKEGKRVLMVATDVYRPAAIDQLVKLGQRIEVPVFELGTGVKPAEIAAKGLAKAKEEKYDAIIVDTAGRTNIDDSMMAELAAVKAAIKPTDTLLVVDAMTGQEAATLVKAFNAAAEITGAILTKLDGDSRGGAALSVRAVSGRPIKYVGTGEKLEALEPFYPDRMAGRILGMGDIVSLVEKAEQAIKADDASYVMKRIMQQKFDFNDFLKQYKMVSGMGPMSSVMKMLPGMGAVTDKQLSAAEKQFKVYESMIQSMTPAEREAPQLLAATPSRRRRIARGSGHKETEVAALIGMFTQMRARMQDFSKMLAMQGAVPGMPGMPMMSEEEMLQSTLATSGPRPVAPGKARRRKPKGAQGARRSRGLAELATL